VAGIVATATALWNPPSNHSLIAAKDRVQLKFCGASPNDGLVTLDREG